MYKVKIKESLSEGWKAFARRPLYLLGLLLGFVVLFVVSIGSALVTALSYIAYGGYIAMLMNHFHGKKIKFDDMFSLDNRWISFAFLGVIKMVLLALGFLCFVVPGIYLAIRWIFAEFLVIDKGMKPLEALKASSKMTEGVKWKLLLFALIVGVLSFLGVFFLLVGTLIVSIVATFALINIYEDLKAKLES